MSQRELAVRERRAPGAAWGVLIVVEHYWTWYRRNWRATVVSSVLQPLLFLLAFGVGFGALLGSTGAGPAIDGVSYLHWLAPGLLAMTAAQTATFESTYPVLSQFKWQRIYHGMVAGPVEPVQVALGHLTWVALKIGGAGLVYVVVIAAFGGVPGPGILVALPVAVLTGIAVAAPVTALSASLETDGSAFNVLFRLVLIPMTLFSGTFFPVAALPGWVRPVAWFSPLWHGTELARAAALWSWQPLPAVGHSAFLLALVVLGGVLAARQYRRKLMP